jgi:uncharacterized protein
MAITEKRAATEDVLVKLERRLGRFYAKQRLGIESAHEAQLVGQGLNFFHIENWYPLHPLVSIVLKLTGLFWRGRRNAERVEVRHNVVKCAHLPPGFQDFTVLHLSDLHVEMSEGAMRSIANLVGDLRYELCVLTGDYRAKTFGSSDATIAGLERLLRHLHGPVYGVLGNHDSIQMVPAMEEMGIRTLLNESVVITRGDDQIHLAGVDDAHFYRVDNLEKAAAHIPADEFSILLSHTPEIYRQAAHAGFDLMLSGHTHGGQVCFPGAIPITLDSHLPRRYGAGAWRYHRMDGYTSVGAGVCISPVRFNCAPEITLHRLSRE